jgi:hypothetical protein
MRFVKRLFGGGKDDKSAGGVGAWATDEEYRTADPREVVQAEGIAMSGPGGAPVEDTSPDERREEQRSG